MIRPLEHKPKFEGDGKLQLKQNETTSKSYCDETHLTAANNTANRSRSINQRSINQSNILEGGSFSEMASFENSKSSFVVHDPLLSKADKKVIKIKKGWDSTMMRRYHQLAGVLSGTKDNNKKASIS